MAVDLNTMLSVAGLAASGVITVLCIRILNRETRIMSEQDDLHAALESAVEAMDDAVAELETLSTDLTELAAELSGATASGDKDAIEAAAQKLTEKAQALESAVIGARTTADSITVPPAPAPAPASAAEPAPAPAPAGPSFTFDPTSLPDAVVGQGYAQQVNVSGGSAPYQFSIASGAFPDGVIMGAGGLINGTPTTEGASSVVIQAHDANNSVGSQSYSLNVAAAPAPQPAPEPAPESDANVAEEPVAE